MAFQTRFFVYIDRIKYSVYTAFSTPMGCFILMMKLMVSKWVSFILSLVDQFNIAGDNP